MKIIILIINLLCSVILYAQKGYVEYGYIESLGLGNAKGLDYNSILIFDQKSSNYVTAKENLEKPEKINGQKVVEEDGEIKAVFNGMGVSKEGNQVYFSRDKGFMLSTLHLDKNVYYIKDSVIKINWEISNETKKIGKFNCIKATANFRGRYYSAWFTLEIPVPYGPWKLDGLPGLILEAYDNDKFVFWYFKNLEYPSNKSEDLNILEETKTNLFVKYSDFKKIQEKIIKRKEEKNAILMQQNSGLEITSPILNELFLECE